MSRLIALLGAVLCFAQSPLPRFDNFPVHERWSGPATPVRLTTLAERVFRTKLSEAAKEQPNFAGHYRITFWGCGSNCSAGTMVDLQSGAVYPLPTSLGTNGWERWINCTACFENTGFESRVDSRLIVDRCGWNFDASGVNYPDTRYYVWEGNRFRLLRHIKQPKRR